MEVRVKKTIFNKNSNVLNRFERLTVLLNGPNLQREDIRISRGMVSGVTKHFPTLKQEK